MVHRPWYVHFFVYPEERLRSGMYIGELRTMFAQEQDEYLDKFFAEHPHPNISWIHQLGKGDYGSASETLLEQAHNASELDSKQVSPTERFLLRSVRLMFVILGS